MTSEKFSNFQMSENGILRFRKRLYVPNVDNIREHILAEAHSTPYSMHPGATKMYRDLIMHYWWPGMKRDVAQFVEQCLICQ